MNDWGFLDEFAKFDQHLTKHIVVLMATSSINPADRIKAEQHKHVRGFVEKFLTPEIMKEIRRTHFPTQP